MHSFKLSILYLVIYTHYYKIIEIISIIILEINVQIKLHPHVLSPSFRCTTHAGATSSHKSNIPPIISSLVKTFNATL